MASRSDRIPDRHTWAANPAASGRRFAARAAPLLLLLALGAGCRACQRCAAAAAASESPVRVTGCVVDPHAADALRRLVFLPAAPDAQARSPLRWTVVNPDGRFVIHLPAGRYRVELHESGRNQPLAAFDALVSEATREFQFQAPASRPTP